MGGFFLQATPEWPSPKLRRDGLIKIIAFCSPTGRAPIRRRTVYEGRYASTYAGAAVMLAVEGQFVPALGALRGTPSDASDFAPQSHSWRGSLSTTLPPESSADDLIENKLILLAPAGSFIPESFTRCSIDRDKHARWLSEVQRVRCGVYLADGALRPAQLAADGRHVQSHDYDSWHLLAMDGSGQVRGCARYRHLTAFSTDPPPWWWAFRAWKSISRRYWIWRRRRDRCIRWGAG